MRDNQVAKKPKAAQALYEMIVPLWPLRKGQTRWLRVVSKLLQIGQYGFLKQKRIGNYRLLLDPGDENDLYYYFDFVGHAYARVVRALLREGDCVIDVGANVGHFSAVCAELVGVKGQVHSIEASPNLFQRLRECFADLPSGPVKVHHAAICRKEGPITFYIGTNSGWSSLVQNDTFVPASHSIVEAVTLDKFVLGQGIAHIHLLKLDIEGAETDALLGAQDCLGSGLIDFILLEAEPCRLRAFEHSGSEIATIMDKYGFVAVAIIREDRLEPVSPSVRIPGSFNGDYLYARKHLHETTIRKLFGE